MAEITNEQLLCILKEEFVPALGCTEPIACALACAKCAETLGHSPDSIEVLVSGNIFKNGMGAGIPGTGMYGLPIAAALGAICGKTEYGLEVLKDITEKNLPLGKQMLENESVSIKIKDNAPDKLYVEATCKYQNEYAKVIILHSHTNIVKIDKNGETIFEKEICNDNTSRKTRPELSVKRICKYIDEVKFEDIKFLLEGVKMNTEISEDGLTNKYGLQVGKTLKDHIKSGLLGEDLLNLCLSRTTAASDARMDGCPRPVMTNSGSGNQGITVYMPIVAVAQYLKKDEETLARAIAMSNLMAAHIHKYMGHLSALCGVIISGMGAGTGITYLLGGDYDKIVNTIKTMGSNITGMMCDGAKQGCALKVYTAVSAAVQASLSSMQGIVCRNDGIIVQDIEETIRNIGLIGSDGMAETDKMILDIMRKK
jgi:L-cysteine desulfidase